MFDELEEKLPPYIIKGRWRDPDWVVIAGKRGPLDDRETARFLAGPREHPYGSDAFEVTVLDRICVFPSPEAYEAYRAAAQERK